MAKCTDLKNQYWPMVKICPEIINFTDFCTELVKYYPEKNLPKFFNKLPQKTKFAQSPGPAIIKLNKDQLQIRVP